MTSREREQYNYYKNDSKMLRKRVNQLYHMVSGERYQSWDSTTVFNHAALVVGDEIRRLQMVQESLHPILDKLDKLAWSR